MKCVQILCNIKINYLQFWLTYFCLLFCLVLNTEINEGLRIDFANEIKKHSDRSYDNNVIELLWS